jgi:hypothetical protein
MLKTTNGRERRYEWASWSNRKLLDARLCDLGLRIHGSELEERIAQLYEELRERGLIFRPHFWLSDDWFCPDGIPGVAIPFFLAHPRLKSLEQEKMLEVEGGTAVEFIKLLRHETGHAIVNAYQIHRKRNWQKHFGRSSVKYPDRYLPRPYSKRYVISSTQLVCAESSPRGLGRNLRRLAYPQLRLAQALPGLGSTQED